MRNPALAQDPATDAIERREWLDSLDYVLQSGGVARAAQLLRQLDAHARRTGARIPFTANTPYANTIPVGQQPAFPGNQKLERRIKSLVRWNALSMVVRANKLSDGIGGHISTYASAATLYEVGFNHFFRGRTDAQEGDIVYFQGHAAPGIYARAFLEGRISRQQLENFRRELASGRRSLVVPAPVADARVLAVPDRLDGARADHVDLPGPLQPLPRRSRPEAGVESEGLGVSRRRRDRRARNARRHHSGLAREARQPDLRHQLQPAAARRPGARQRPDHPGARGDLPRRRLERHQGDLGQRLGSARGEGHRRPARAAARGDRRRAVPEVRRRRRRLHAPAPLRQQSAPARHGAAPLGRRSEAAAARRARPAEGLRRLQGRRRAQGPADRHPRAHHQGLRPGRSRRRQEHHAPAEEAERGRAARVPQPVRYRPERRGAGTLAVLPSGGRQPRDALPAGAPQGARRLPPRAHRDRAADEAQPRADLRGVLRGHRRAQGLHDDGVREDAGEAAARQGRRQARRADRPRRSAHLRHGVAVPRGRHLLRTPASSTSPSTWTRCSTTRK